MYRFKRSVVYYELMMIDVSRIEFDSPDDKKKNVVPDEESIKKNEESLRKAQERRQKEQDGWEQINLSDVINNANTE